MLYGLTKNDLSSLSLSFTSKYGQVPILSLILNVGVLSSINFISFSFSAAVRTLLSNGTFRHKISSSFFVLGHQHLAMKKGPAHFGHLLYVVSVFVTHQF